MATRDISRDIADKMLSRAGEFQRLRHEIAPDREELSRLGYEKAEELLP